MKNIALITNAIKDVGLDVTKAAIDILSSEGMSVYVANDLGSHFSDVITYSSFPDNIDLIIVVGGDGSVIDASKYAVKYDIPLLGINLGKVGYLAEVENDNLSVLKQLKDGSYTISDKMLLEIELINKGAVVSELAVNDIVASHDEQLLIADFKIEDSVGNVIKYRADGIIFATPQGSTAYSLSAGGPILAHDVESILMTPVSPHSFFNRSVLFNSGECIRVTNISEYPLAVRVDGRMRGSLNKNEICTVRKSARTIKMLTFSKNSMFSSLFRKMRIIGDMD